MEEDKITDFPKVCKGKIERSVAFVQVSLYKIKEADKAVSCGGGLVINCY